MLSMATALKSGIVFEFCCSDCQPATAAPNRNKSRRNDAAEAAPIRTKRRRNAAAVEGNATPAATHAAAASHVGGAARVRPYRKRASSDDKN